MKEDLKKKNKAEKVCRIDIRISEAQDKFIKVNDYSPTRIFNQALELLGFKETKRGKRK